MGRASAPGHQDSGFPCCGPRDLRSAVGATPWARSSTWAPPAACSWPDRAQGAGRARGRAPGWTPRTAFGARADCRLGPPCTDATGGGRPGGQPDRTTRQEGRRTSAESGRRERRVRIDLAGPGRPRRRRYRGGAPARPETRRPATEGGRVDSTSACLRLGRPSPGGMGVQAGGWTWVDPGAGACALRVFGTPKLDSRGYMHKDPCVGVKPFQDGRSCPEPTTPSPIGRVLIGSRGP